MLRPSRFQSGKSRHRGEVRRAQHQPSLITRKCQPGSELQYSNPLPRAFLLLDVRGRLSRVENSGRRLNRSTQFSFRKICERHSGTRTRKGTIFSGSRESVAIHAHCHAKSIVDPTFMARLVDKLPGRKAKLLDTGCCGMAGAFGMMESKRDLSLKVAAHLLAKIDAEGPDATVVASGTSCRHQISDFSNRHPKHMAEVLADALT